MAVATGTAILGAAALGAGGSVMAARSQGGSSESGMTLPPQLQYEMLQSSTKSLQFMEQNYEKIGELSAAYDARINTIAAGIEGTMLSEDVMKQLTESSANIALQLGAGAEDLIANGFLDEDDIRRIEELDQYNDQDFVDQQFEQEHDQQRSALEQQLLRDGRSMAEIAQTLSVFDSQKSVERQQRGEILRSGTFDRGLATLSAKQDIRAQNFGQLSDVFRGQQQLVAGQQNSLFNLANLRQNQAATQSGLIDQQQGVLSQQQEQYDAVGAYKLRDAKGENGQVAAIRRGESYDAYADSRQKRKSEERAREKRERDIRFTENKSSPFNNQ